MITFLKNLKGYVTIVARGTLIDRFLNLCAQNNIYIWNVKNIKENTYSLCMSIKGFKYAAKIAYETHTKLSISGKKGFPFFVYKLRFRKGIITGSIIAVIMFLFLTSFVWRIDVEGNDVVTDAEIIDALKASGFKKGSFRYFLDEEDLQNQMLLKIKKLSWMWVYLDGTRARVEVRERVDPPEIIDKTTPSNIVANFDGLITDIVAKDGEAKVKVGDVVKKGDLLISGVVSIGEDKFRLTNARGEVFARTWREKKGNQPLNIKKYKKTGKKITKKVVKLPWFDVLLYMDNNVPYTYYDETKYQSTPSFFGLFDFPFTYRKTVYEEKIAYTQKLTSDMALKLKKQELEDELRGSLRDTSEIINITEKHTEENDHLTVTVTFECVEQIGEKVFINGG